MTRPQLALLAMWLPLAAWPVHAQAPDPFALPPKGTGASATFKGPIVAGQTPQLALQATLSDATAAPGKRLSIAYDIQPAGGIHVYAPGKHDYQVIDIALDPQPWLRADKPVYPKPEIYHFKPIDERVEVYSRPFTLTQDVTILATPEAQKQLANLKTITISGKVNYQACDDKVCYAPKSIPVKWTVPFVATLK